MTSCQNIAIWPMFNLVDSKLKGNIRKAYVFGPNGDQAMFITTDGNVYSFGLDTNAYGSLGLGDVYSTLEPKKIDVLCKKGIFCLAFGEHSHVIAASSHGEVYGWGYGGEYGVGDANGNNRNIPVALVINLEGQQVAKVCCGGGHSMLLTKSGEVYCWGQGSSYQCGLGTTNPTTRPTKVTSGIGGKLVRDVVCGQNTSYTLSENGEIYGWGLGSSGQLGTRNADDSATPVLASSLQGIYIKQVVSGSNHALALSDTGHVYSFGENNFGQLGNGNTTSASEAKVISGNLGEITQIAAVYNCDISAAMTKTGEVYMWGFCKFQAVTSPTLTEFSTLDDVFANFAKPCVTWRPLSLVTDIIPGIAKDLIGSLRNGLDDSETADTFFIVEEKQIAAHKAILMIRCEYFRKMFQSQWKESKQSEIKIKSFTYDAFRAFLEYIYTGEVDVKIEVAIDLLQLADCYHELNLKKICEETLKRGIKVENCAYLYSAASKYSAKALQEYCSKFAANHMTAVMSSKAFQNIDDAKLLKQFLLVTSKWGAFKY